MLSQSPALSQRVDVNGLVIINQVLTEKICRIIHQPYPWSIGPYFNSISLSVIIGRHPELLQNKKQICETSHWVNGGTWHLNTLATTCKWASSKLTIHWTHWTHTGSGMPCHQPPMDIRSPDVLARRPAIIGKAAVGLRTRLKHMKQKVGWNRVCIYRALLNNDTFGYIKFIYIYIYIAKSSEPAQLGVRLW